MSALLIRSAHPASQPVRGWTQQCFVPKLLVQGSALLVVILFLRILTTNKPSNQTKKHLQLCLIIFPSFVKWLLEILKKEKQKLEVESTLA